MKTGIVLLVVGGLLLLASIPYSILAITAGVMQSASGNPTGGVLAWAGIIGVVAGFVLVTIGATKTLTR